MKRHELNEKVREMFDNIDTRIKPSMWDKWYDYAGGVTVDRTETIDGYYFRTFQDGNKNLIDGRTICDVLNAVAEIRDFIANTEEDED